MIDHNVLFDYICSECYSHSLIVFCPHVTCGQNTIKCPISHDGIHLVPVRFFDPAIDCSDSVTRLLDLRKVHTEALHSLHTVFTTAYWYCCWQCILNIESDSGCTHCNDKSCFTVLQQAPFCMLCRRRHSVCFSRRHSVFCMLYSRRHSV